MSDNAASADDDGDGPSIAARLLELVDRLLEVADSIQSTVRTRSAPVIAAADDHLRPVLSAKVFGFLIALLIGGVAVGGAFIFVSQTLGKYTTGTVLALALVGGTVALLAAGAISWGGSRRTSYW